MKRLNKLLLIFTLSLILPHVILAKVDPWKFHLPETSYQDLTLSATLQGTTTESKNAVTSTISGLYFKQAINYNNFFQNDYTTLQYNITQNWNFTKTSFSIPNEEQQATKTDLMLSGNISLNQHLSRSSLFYISGAFAPNFKLDYQRISITTNNHTAKNSDSLIARAARFSGGIGYGKLYDVTLLYRVNNIINMLKKRYHLNDSQIPDKFINTLTSILYRKNEYIKRYRQPVRSGTPDLAWKKIYYTDIQQCLETIPELQKRVDFFTIASIDEIYSEYHPQRLCGAKVGTSIEHYTHASDRASVNNNDYTTLQINGEIALPISDIFHFSGKALYYSKFLNTDDYQYASFSTTLSATLARNTFLDLVAQFTIYDDSLAAKGQFHSTIRAALTHKISDAIFLSSSIAYYTAGEFESWDFTTKRKELSCNVALEWRFL